MERLLAFGVGVPIGEAVIDGGEAGGAAIAEIAELHRRRTPGERKHTIEAGVAGKIDKNINLIVADQRRHLIVVHTVRLVSIRRQILELGGHRVFLRRVGVTDRMEGFPVIRSKKRHYVANWKWN